MCPDKTTGGRNTKFGIITPEDVPSGAIKGFFQFPSWSRVMGPTPGGWEQVENTQNFFFQFDCFFLDFDKYGSLVSLKFIILSYLPLFDWNFHWTVQSNEDTLT